MPHPPYVWRKDMIMNRNTKAPRKMTAVSRAIANLPIEISRTNRTVMIARSTAVLVLVLSRILRRSIDPTTIRTDRSSTPLNKPVTTPS